MEKLANVATILGCVIYVLLTLTDRWSAITTWGGTSMYFKISLVFLMVAVISAGFMIYFARHKKKSKPFDIIRNYEGDYYLVEKGICSHIPDKSTLQYLGNLFGIDWRISKTIPRNEIEQDKEIPSIKTHFSNQDT